MELPTVKVNPWEVDTLDVYLHYCCPECDHKSKTKLLFVNHAFSCHPDAKGPSMSLLISVRLWNFEYAGF